MNILLILLIIIGFVLVIIAFKWMSPVIGIKRLEAYSILELTQSVNLPSKGKYSIAIVGGAVKQTGNFGIRMEMNGENIPIIPYFLGWFDYYGLTRGTRLYHFKTTKKGIHEMTIQYPRDLVVKPTMLPITSLFTNQVAHENLSIVFQRLVPIYKILISLLMIFITVILWLIAAVNYQF